MVDRCARWALAVVALTALSQEARGQGNLQSPGVIPPQAKFKGLTYGEWQEIWQQTSLAIPVDEGHPFLTGEVFGEEKGIRFLAGVFGDETFEVTIPAGTALFFPVAVAECSNLEEFPFFGADEEEQADCANLLLDLFTDLTAEVDGRPIRDLLAYRSLSPQYEFSVPEDNIIGVDGPATGTSVSAGYFLLLSPLSVGTHTIHLSAAIPDFDLAIDNMFVVTVLPRR